MLDTRRGDDSERLYTRLGYETAGVIPRYAASPSGDALDDVVYMYGDITSKTLLPVQNTGSGSRTLSRRGDLPDAGTAGSL